MEQIDFCFDSVAAAIQKLWPFFQSHVWRNENGDWQYAITNSPIKVSVFLLQSSDKLWKVHYVTANRFMYKLGWTNLYYRNCGSSLRACTLRKHVYNYSDLENRMSLTSHTSTAIAMRPKILALLYWMDWCILQAYLWKYLNITERLFMISTRDKNPCWLETANSLKQAMNPAYFIIQLQV